MATIEKEKAIDVVKQMVADGQVSQEVAEKYFPELKESEDERIRKALLEMVHDTTGDSLWVDYNVHKDDVLAWLEKQGEQKIDPDTLIQQRMDALADIVAEQKPADKGESFDEYEGLTDFERTLADICIGWIGQEPGWKQYIKDNANVLLKIAIKKFNSVQDTTFEQKPAEWSEEDNLQIQAAIDICKSSGHTITSDWLKSIKDKIQPKQEWSEEDSRILYNVKAYIGYAAGQSGVKDELFKEANEWLNSLPIGFIYSKNYNEDMVTLLVSELKQIANDNNVPEQYQMEINWLKSLRPQKQWKPSEEQMETLENVRKILHTNDIYSKANNLMYNFEELIRTLKKLRDGQL